MINNVRQLSKILITKDITKFASSRSIVLSIPFLRLAYTINIWGKTNDINES